MDGGKLPQLMKNAGFVDVRRRKIKVEIGPWGPGSTPVSSLSIFMVCRSPQASGCCDVRRCVDGCNACI